MNVIESVKKLNFPSDEYIVVGTGIMAVLGLKESHDIDIVVSPRLFELSKSNGWLETPYTYPDKIGQIYLKKDDMELYLDVNCGQFNPTLNELLSRKEVFDDINFISFGDLLRFKKEYNRPKDAKDIALIEKHLAEQLKKEGFASVYEWTDVPNTKYSEHAHKGKVSFFVIRGSVTFSGNITKTVSTGERFDVPVGANHFAVVGPEGCDWVVGEEVEGDS
ncbi:MAG: hypothetical protein Q8L64_03800 [bacterium]|nr:hypothetical protein [bacterium]